MASNRAEANRQNAMQSTGPRTQDGKRRSSMNALTHGLTAALRPLPGLEDGEAWERHLAATVESLAPVGYLEEILAERIAVQAWRLRRVVLYESESAALAIEEFDAKLPPDQAEAADTLIVGAALGASPLCRQTLAEVKANLGNTEAAIALLNTLPDAPAGQRLEAGPVILLLRRLAAVAGAEQPDGTEAGAWTAGRFRDVAADLAGERFGGSSMLMAALWLDLKLHLGLARREIDQRRRQDAAERVRLMLPGGDTLANLTRYEAALERSLFASVHELQRLQAARAGGRVPVPLAVDFNSSGT